jgi:hypothetical protein
MLSKKSKIEQLPKSRESRFSAASAAASLSRTHTKLCGRLLAIRCAPPTSADAVCIGGAEKFGSPARKTFFDSIGHKQTTWCGGLVRTSGAVAPGVTDNRTRRGHSSLICDFAD